jgi:aspartate ammonia-lyase
MIVDVKAFENDETIREVAHEQADLSDEELDRVLDARKMAQQFSMRYERERVCTVGRIVIHG